MIRKSALLILSVLLGGCFHTEIIRYSDFPSVDEVSDCQGRAAPPLRIFYGDSKIKVDNHVYHIKKRDFDVFRVDLHPDNNSVEGADYEELEIMLIGKDAKSQWLNRKLKASDSNNGRFRFCVRDQRAGSYYFLLVVPGVGELDPRVDVED